MTRAEVSGSCLMQRLPAVASTRLLISLIILRFREDHADVNGKTVGTIRRTGDFSEKAMKVPNKNEHGDAIREEFKLHPETPRFPNLEPILKAKNNMKHSSQPEPSALGGVLFHTGSQA